MSKKPRSRRNAARTAPHQARAAANPARTPAPSTAGTRRTPRIRSLALAAIALVTLIAGTTAFLVLRDRAPDSGALKVATIAAPEFVGGKVCAECHGAQASAWRGSDHDLAMQVASEQTVLGDFADARYAYSGTTSTFFRRDGRFYVKTDGADGKLADHEIKYTFGARPLQQYLIELPGGRLQALSIAWDSRPKAQGGQRWFHLYPEQDIRAGDPLHWTRLGQNWNFMCAECHSTNLRKNYDASTDVFKTTWSEMNVSCEACHGPGSNHISWARKQGDVGAFAASKGLALALDERRGVAWTPIAETGNAKRSKAHSSAREVETCARCHARAARISDDYRHGSSLLDTHRPSLIEEDRYTVDGQMRDEVYNWGSFLQSRMFAMGVTCSDCHDPHSLRLRAAGNAICASCHRAEKFDTEAHTHHPAGSAGGACVACHMPARTYMVVDPRHDHSLRIPRPDLSVKLGTPNACNDCHDKRSAQWAADAVARWYGKPAQGYQTFAEAFHAASIGAPGGRSALVNLIDDKTQPAIVRASALARLAPLLTQATVDFVARTLNDSDPIVRLAAVETLAAAAPAERARYLVRMLSDPVRAVRIEAARALAGESEAGVTGTDRARFDQAHAEYVAVQTYNADRPEAHVNLGSLHATRGNHDGAIAALRKALELDPTFVPAYANLADLYRLRAAEYEAEQVLRQGIDRTSSAAALHYALGLSLVRQKRGPEALRELAEATRFEPANARYAYVLAVAQHDGGQLAAALETLRAALPHHPYDPDLLTTLAMYTAQAGDRDRALRYAATLRELDPENAGYARLAAQIQGAGKP